MSSTAIRVLANGSRARLSSTSAALLPLAYRPSASLVASNTIARTGLSTRHMSDSAASSSSAAAAALSCSSSCRTSAGGRLSLAILAAAVSAACVTLYQLAPAYNEATPVQPNSPGSPGLSSKEFTPLKLKSVQPYNHNSAIYTFELPDANSYLNLPVSSCLMLRGKGADGKEAVRPYTPIDTHRKGEVVLLIKSYDKGNLSQYVRQLKPGQTLDFKGPMPKLKYEVNAKKRIGMLAGGTGITPMLQVLEEIARNPKDNTETHLVFANVSGKDILLKETLDALAQQHSNIKVTYVIDSKDNEKDWAGEVGHINKELIKKLVPFTAKDKDVLIYVCGPPAFMKAISGDKAKDYSQGEVDGALKELGFSSNQVYKF